MMHCNFAIPRPLDLGLGCNHFKLKLFIKFVHLGYLVLGCCVQFPSAGVVAKNKYGGRNEKS